jgi:hypothetical protein
MNLKNTFLALLAIAFSFGITTAQTARLQVIHNSADAAASTVDIWLTVGMMAPAKLIDDLQFRHASAFIDAPAGVALKVGVAPANSTMISDTIKNFNLTLTNGATYVAVANGIVSASGYSPAPAFGLDIYAMGREAATMGTNTDVLVCHGSTDAPTVDVVEVGVGAGTIVDNASYGDFAGYLELGTADYALQVRTGEGNTTVAEYAAPLQTLGLNGAAAVVVASGFLNPANNSNGPAFGLYVALPTGGALVALPSAPISTARVQVIHNSADLAAATVDVWLDNTLLLDNFAFRTASPFIDAPAGSAFDIRIQGPTSTDTLNPIAKITYTLTGGEKYILVANGIVSATGYSPATAFDILVRSGAKEKATTSGNVDVLVLHGATDAPAVDVVETGVGAGILVPNATYGNFYGYLDLGTADYALSINAAGTSTTVATYQAPLATLGLADEAFTVLASGFLAPSSNSNGPAFGLWVALAAGGNLVELPLLTSVEEIASNVSGKSYPNPATDVIHVQYALKTPAVIAMKVRDLSGREVLSENLGTQSIGSHEMDVNVSTLPAGSYLLELSGDQQRLVQKINVVR